MFRTLRLFAIALVALGLMALPGFISSAQQGNIASIIVELNPDPAAVDAARARQNGNTLSDDQLEALRNQIRLSQDQFLAAARSRGINAQLEGRDVRDSAGVARRVDLRYTLVFNGLALKVPEASVAAIEAMPQVKKVHSNSVLTPELYKSVSYIRAPEVYGGVAELGPFDNLREGYEGQGVNIAIIDTGIDWPHEMFGSDPTPPRLGVAPTVAALNTHQKVIYSLPLTDAVTDGFGHGTHVASTAAGYLGFAPGADGIPMTADDIRLHGVAPQARLMSYKVCSDSRSTISQVQPIGGCETADIVRAIEDAVSPRTITGLPKPIAHVINMSLGGGGGPDHPAAIASGNAVLLGTIVVASAGNSGPGQGTVGAPSVGSRVISVAAVTDPGSNAGWSTDVLAPSSVNRNSTGAVIPANNLPAAANERRDVRLFPMAGTPAPPAGSLAQYYVFVRNGQLIDEFPASVSGRIALVKSSSPRLPQTTFAQVANNAAAAGAVGVILVSTTQTPTAVRATIPAANILPADGEYLVDLLSSTDNNNVDPPGGAISEFPIRMNPFFGQVFAGEMAGFSSRGPMRTLGQVKPDIAAPGVNVLAAVPPASLLGALAGGSYGAVSGTSMASPHAAGVAALIRQAHPTWDPDTVRTVMINTATNLRNEGGVAKADGLNAESVLDQGGGLVDVFEAIHAKAAMGVAGNGISEPAILGSHSYGEVPVVNSRVTHTESVTVTVRDLSGQGGTYNLNVANNRDLQLDGINVALSPASVSVPANGSATFTVNATIDGDLIRDTVAAKVINNQVIFESLQLQWYVVAERADGAERVRMPFYLKPGTALPANPIIQNLTHTGTVLLGDSGSLTAAGVTYVDVPFQVDSSTYKLDARVEWLELVDDQVADLDYQLLGPGGQLVASSGAPGGPESVSIRVTQPGTYTHRVVGFANGPTDFTIRTTLSRGGPAPTLQSVPGDFTDGQGRNIDFDGSFTIQWQPAGGEQGYEIEQSTDNQNWQLIGSTSGGTTSLAVSVPNGQYFFRVRSLLAGRIGYYITPPSNVASVLVDQRVQQQITSLIGSAVSNVSLASGVFQFDLTLKNQSSEVYVPLVEFQVVAINSASGTVAAINADNGGNGRSQATRAVFDYSRRLGADEEFAPTETTGTRTLQFRDSASELFTYDAIITAYVRMGGGGSGGGAPAGAGGGSASGGSTNPLGNLTALMRFTVNPLTRTVTPQLIRLNP